jgi:hypothetical protein
VYHVLPWQNNIKEERRKLRTVRKMVFIASVGAIFEPT